MLINLLTLVLTINQTKFEIAVVEISAKSIASNGTGIGVLLFLPGRMIYPFVVIVDCHRKHLLH